MNRRSFLIGLTTLVASPAIVRASSLMALSPVQFVPIQINVTVPDHLIEQVREMMRNLMMVPPELLRSSGISITTEEIRAQTQLSSIHRRLGRLAGNRQSLITDGDEPTAQPAIEDRDRRPLVKIRHD